MPWRLELAEGASISLGALIAIACLALALFAAHSSTFGRTVYAIGGSERSAQLMDLYGVAVCVVEINPNYNDAKKFANRFPGRVFICDSFGSLKEDMIVWGDAPRLDPSDRRTAEDARDRYTLRMDQYKCMQVSMARFTAAEPLCVFPDPQGLAQEVVDKGQRQVVAVLPRAFHQPPEAILINTAGGLAARMAQIFRSGRSPSRSRSSISAPMVAASSA